MSKITEATEVFVPRYHKLQEVLQKHEQAHWIVAEVDVRKDIEQWRNGTIDEGNKNFIKMILRLFTQSDTNVCSGYVEKLLPIFKNADARMMLVSFASRECFDDATEVLTDAGWKLFKDLGAESVAQYSLETGQISFAKPLSYVTKEYNGILHHYKNSRTDICVTPNHDIVVRHPSTKKIEKRKSVDGVWGRNYQYPSAGVSSAVSDRLTDFEKLLVAIQADGCVINNTPAYDRDNNSVVISFSVKKKRKIERLEQLLSSLSLNCHATEKVGGISGYKFTLYKEQIHPDLIKNFGWVNIESMSTEKAAEFISEVLFWDGSDGKVWYNTNLPAVDVVQSIATLCGLTTTIGINRKEGIHKVLGTDRQTQTCYVVSFSSSKWKEYPYRQEVAYSGKVYCVQMPEGTVVTRRNGKVSIQGNCTHMLGYKFLNDSLGLDSEEFLTEFLQYKEMADKHEFMLAPVDLRSNTNRASYLAKQILMEGVNLFGSFAMLLNYSRLGWLQGTVSVNQWSIVDESLHVEGLTEIFKIFVEEHPHLVTEEFKRDIYQTARDVVKLEDEFIDLCFSVGTPPKLDKQELKDYIRYVADYRMKQMGFKPQFNISYKPLPWVDDMVGNVFGDFFDVQIVEYSKGNLSGTWD